MVATAARVAIDPLVGDNVPFITYLPAVLITALLGGFGPGLAAMVLSGSSAWYFVLPPKFSFALSPTKFSMAELIAFICATVISVVFVTIINAIVERALERHRALVQSRDLLIQELPVSIVVAFEWLDQLKFQRHNLSERLTNFDRLTLAAEPVPGVGTIGPFNEMKRPAAKQAGEPYSGGLGFNGQDSLRPPEGKFP